MELLSNNKINEIDYLRIELKIFIESGFFDITQQGDYLFFGVKKGYLKPLKLRGYNQKTILKYLDLIEYGLNNGLICPECLQIGLFSVDDVNVFDSRCLEHGSLI